METKDELVKSIKDWIIVDNEIKNLQIKLKILRQEKKDITSGLVNVMRSNEIDCFDIKDGKLLYSKSTVKKPISKNYLEKTLALYFENDDDKGSQLCKFILDQREVKVNESIRRKIIN